MIGYYIKDFCLVVLIALPFYLLIRRPWKKWSKREAALAGFVLYMAGLWMLTLGISYQRPDAMISWAIDRIRAGEGINLVPFRTISTYMQIHVRELFLVNIVGNIVMFMPWGFGLMLLWRRKQRLWSVLLHALGLTVFIEFVQLFVGRSVDVDDVILNFLGSCLGAALYFLMRKLFPKLGTLAQ